MLYKEQKKACCIVICYCEVRKIQNSYYTVKDRRPGKIVFLHDMNDNIIISYPYYSGVYQYKSTKGELYQEINSILGWNQTKTKPTKLRCTLLMQ